MLEGLLRNASPLLARLAIAHTGTLRGAERIYHAERAGLNRPEVLRTAARRIEELGGTEPPRSKPLLEVRGEAVETPRIVAAVARGRRHPGW